MIRGALYARVSTLKQEQERTIDIQVEALRARAAALGWALPEDHGFLDDGWSGTRLDRPALDRLRDAAADGRLDALLVFDPDRLARSLVHQQVLLEEFARRGVQVHFLERAPSERPEDRLLVQMQGVFAEYERTRILERTRRGRLHKARTEAWAGWSTPPYGYRMVVGENDRRVPVIDEAEAAWVKRAYAWVQNEGLSARRVAKRLNERGVTPRRARIWSAGSAHNILTSPTYAGTAIHNRTRAAEPKRRRDPGAYARSAKSSHAPRPQEQWITVPVPALVTAEAQARVRERLSANKWQSPRDTRHEYLLRGLVVCGECGWRMTATRLHGGAGDRYEYVYYACGARDAVDTGRPEGRCGARRVRADRLDAAVWASLCEWLRDPDVLRAQLDALTSSRSTASTPGSQEEERSSKVIRDTTKQIDRLIDAFQEGVINVAELRTRRESIEKRVADARARLSELETLRRQEVKVTDLLQDVDAFAATLRSGLNNISFDERRRIALLLIDRVVVKADEEEKRTTVTIDHVVPLKGRFCGLRQDDLCRPSGRVRGKSAEVP